MGRGERLTTGPGIDAVQRLPTGIAKSAADSAINSSLESDGAGKAGGAGETGNEPSPIVDE